MNKKIVIGAASVVGFIVIGASAGGWFISDKAAHMAQENALQMLKTQYPAMDWKVPSSKITYFPWPAVQLPSVSGVAKSEQAKVKSLELKGIKGSLEIGAINKSVPLSNVSVDHVHASYVSNKFTYTGLEPSLGEINLDNVKIKRFNKADPKVDFEGVLKDPSMMPLTLKGEVSGDNVLAIQKDIKSVAEWSLKGHVMAKSVDGDAGVKPLELSFKLHSKSNVLYSDAHVRGNMASVKSETKRLNFLPDLDNADLTVSATAPLPEKLKDIPNAPWKIVSVYGTIKSVQAVDLVNKLRQLPFAGLAKQMDSLSGMFSDATLEDITLLTHEDRIRVKSDLFKSGKKQGVIEGEAPLQPLNEKNELGALDFSFTSSALNPAHYSLHASAWDNQKSEVNFEFTLPETKAEPFQLSNLWNISVSKILSGMMQNKVAGHGKIQKSDAGFEINLDKIEANLSRAEIDGTMVATVNPQFSKLTGVTANFRSPQLYITENLSPSSSISKDAMTLEKSSDLNPDKFVEELISQWVLTADKVRLDFRPQSLVFDEVNYHNPLFSLELRSGYGKASVSDYRTEGPNLLADVEWDTKVKPIKWKVSAHPAMIPSSYLAYLLGQPNFLQGAIYMTGNMEFTGYTEKQLMRSAKGSLGLAMNQGQIHRTALLPLLGKWGSFLSVLGDGRIPVKCAGAVTDWNAGNLNIKHLGLIAKHVSITGDGSEDFAAQKLTLNLEPRLTLMGRSMSKNVSLEDVKGQVTITKGADNKDFKLGFGGSAHESCEALFGESRLGEEPKKAEKVVPGHSGFLDILSGK